MKKIFVLIGILIALFGVSQTTYQPLGSTFGNNIERINARKGFQLPRGTDTTLNGSLDSVGMLFYKMGDTTLWLRVPKTVGSGNIWRKLNVSGGGNTIYTGDGVITSDRIVDINGNGFDFINGSVGIGNFYFAPYTSAKKIVRTPTPLLSNQYLPMSVNGIYASSTGNIVDTAYKHYADSVAGGGGSSQWTTTGSDIYNNNAGNVGIGTTTPQGKLDVVDGGSELLIDNVNKINKMSASGGDDVIYQYTGGSYPDHYLTMYVGDGSSYYQTPNSFSLRSGTFSVPSLTNYAADKAVTWNSGTGELSYRDLFGIDDVLAVGQVLTADRDILTGGYNFNIGNDALDYKIQIGVNTVIIGDNQGNGGNFNNLTIADASNIITLGKADNDPFKANIRLNTNADSLELRSENPYYFYDNGYGDYNGLGVGEGGWKLGKVGTANSVNLNTTSITENRTRNLIDASGKDIVTVYDTFATGQTSDPDFLFTPPNYGTYKRFRVTPYLKITSVGTLGVVTSVNLVYRDENSATNTISFGLLSNGITPLNSFNAVGIFAFNPIDIYSQCNGTNQIELTLGITNNPTFNIGFTIQQLN